jgi:ketosteroid isomerase-like protein
VIPLEDRLGVRELVERYALTVDERDLDAVAALFTEDARLILPDPPDHLTPVTEHRGRDAVRAALGSVTAIRGTVHEITGQRLDSAGSGDSLSLRGVVSGVAHHYLDRDGDLVDLVWRLRYDDEYHQAADRWRFAARALTVVTIELRPIRAMRPVHRDNPG